MYHYIIDQSRLSLRNFDKLLGEVYGYLTEHQISGEVHRVTRLRNVEELTESALRTGAKTLIAVGDDQLFLQMLEVLAREPGVVLGYIPLAAQSEIAGILGVGNLQEACRAIAQRRIQEFDLGTVNRHHFFTNIKFGFLSSENLSLWNIFSKVRFLEPQPVSVRVDSRYSVFANILAGTVINASSARIADGMLDLVLIEKMSARELLRHKNNFNEGDFSSIPGATVLHGKNFEIEGPKTMPVNMGFGSFTRMPLTAAVAEEKVKVLIGKTR